MAVVEEVECPESRGGPGHGRSRGGRNWERWRSRCAPPRDAHVGFV